MNINFAAKTALVTGACRGIGKAVTQKLVQCGAKVVAVSNTPELAKLAEEFPDQVEPINVDLKNWEATRKALEGVGVDYLVNCAGVVQLEPVGAVTEAAVDHQFDVNVKVLISLF